MPKKTDHDYFEWLISQIEVPDHRTYMELFERMHDTEFVWIIPNDDNRVQDGLDLRTEFLEGMHGTINKKLEKGVSLLEILISLSRRTAFIAGGDASFWAWQLITNLRLNRMFDPLSRGKSRKMDEIFYALIWRTYQRNGEGGFFPLNWPPEDQTKVEIWYQMNEYVHEIQQI